VDIVLASDPSTGLCCGRMARSSPNIWRVPSESNYWLQPVPEIKII
jgi:hypothetical protein